MQHEDPPQEMAMIPPPSSVLSDEAGDSPRVEEFVDGGGWAHDVVQAGPELVSEPAIQWHGKALLESSAFSLRRPT